MAITAGQLVDDALTEIGVLADGEVARATDAQRALRILNRDIIEPWNIITYFATHRVITSGTFLASSSTIAIGPTGIYVLVPRPEELLQAHWVSTDAFRTPIMIRDADWYASLTDPTRTGTEITDIAYFPTSPNGTMYPWPIPESAVTVEIETRSILTRFPNLTTAVDLANGYESAIVRTLGELLCAPFGRPMPDELPMKAAKARDVVMATHMKARRISTIPY